jgi:hypothetical protein
MNASIARSRTRSSPRWREKTMMITCSSKPHIPLHESLYHPQYPWVGVLHQMNAKTVLQKIEQRAYEEQPQGFEAYQKETLVSR